MADAMALYFMRNARLKSMEASRSARDLAKVEAKTLLLEESDIDVALPSCASSGFGELLGPLLIGNDEGMAEGLAKGIPVITFRGLAVCDD